MPATNVWGFEWLNANSVRSYPLSDAATKTDVSGSFRLPDSTILSLYLPVSAGINVQAENFYLSKLAVFSSGLLVQISYNDGSDEPPLVASASLSFSNHYEYKSYSLVGVGNFSDSVGKIVLGSINDLKALPAGDYSFSYAGGKLDTDCVRPVLRGVTSLTLVNGNDTSDKLVGEIQLVAGTNMRLTVVSSNANTSVVRFDAISGEGLSKDCVCTDNNEEAPCIRTINGIAPTAAGDFSVLSDEGMTITPINNGIRLEDASSKPCCGCAELEAVTRELTKFGDSALTFQNYLNRLEGSVNRMNLTVLGSKLSDVPCVQ
jgi:hypothetical protein